MEILLRGFFIAPKIDDLPPKPKTMVQQDLKFHCLFWDQLNKEELYELLRLRQEVFVYEQYCPFIDNDGLDQKALHLWLSKEELPIAYSRVLPPGSPYKEASFGRLLVAKSHRGEGLASYLLEQSLLQIKSQYGAVPIRIMAQHYLVDFYSRFGFKKLEGAVWEDDILHFYMTKEA